MSIFEGWPTKEQGASFVAGVKAERERIIDVLQAAKVINSDQKYFLIQAIKAEK